MRLRKEIDEMQEKDILLIAKISDALAHPARIKIFRYIMQENKNLSKVCNKDLVAYFDYSQATISQHVKKLKDAGLLEVKKQDRYSYYYVHLGTLHDYLTATKKFENMEQQPSAKHGLVDDEAFFIVRSHFQSSHARLHDLIIRSSIIDLLRVLRQIVPMKKTAFPLPGIAHQIHDSMNGSRSLIQVLMS